MRKLALIALVCGLSATRAWPVDAPDTSQAQWMQRVLKVTVVRNDGRRELGSAVPLGGDRLVTNCHVLRGAREIRVETPVDSWLATSDERDVYRDLCFLRARGYDAGQASMIEAGATRVGLEVSAVGYSGGEFNLTRGRVIGLFTCECDGGKVIQTSARFDRGASGGGLFDQAGRLVGILTFKAKAGGKYHFALPVGWLRHLSANDIQPIVAGDTFWEKPGKESAHFLAACDLGAKKSWDSLSRLAEDWISQEPDNPEAWMVKGRASMGLDRKEQAIAAFQRALMLESTHAEAKWELQKLEFEMGRKLLDADSL
jgi:serine protease Do